MTYADKLKDPRWQKKRLQILERDKWMCQECYDSSKTLHVHHHDYEQGCEPWDYPDYYLVTLCEDCHKDVPLYRKPLEEGILKRFRLNLTDHFSFNCAASTISQYDDIQRLFFLLWDLDQSAVMETLENLHLESKKEVSINFYQKTGKVLDMCIACGGKMVFYEKYKYHKCDTCGFGIPSIEGELIKSPTPDGK